MKIFAASDFTQKTWATDSSPTTPRFPTRSLNSNKVFSSPMILIPMLSLWISQRLKTEVSWLESIF